MSIGANADFDELAERGLRIYDALKGQLEPEQNGRVVAIHVDTGSYATGRNSHEAVQSLRKTYPDGRLAILTIGPEPDYALAARYIAGEMRASGIK